MRVEDLLTRMSRGDMSAYKGAGQDGRDMGYVNRSIYDRRGIDKMYYEDDERLQHADFYWDRFSEDPNIWD